MIYLTLWQYVSLWRELRDGGRQNLDSLIPEPPLCGKICFKTGWNNSDTLRDIGKKNTIDKFCFVFL